MCKNTLAAGFRGAGPTIRNPLQAAKQRSCGYTRYLHLYTVPRRGTDTSRMMLRMIVSPALRNQERKRDAYPTAAWLLFCYGWLRGYGETP